MYDAIVDVYVLVRLFVEVFKVGDCDSATKAGS
jgi:hypothetical protein